MKPQLLTDWSHQDVTGWLASEKLDGWRMLWDGKCFLSRQGKVLNPPSHWFSGMPDFPLDGELFAGRGEFNTIQSRMRDGWEGLRFHVFDVPSMLPFHARAAALAALELPEHCAAVDHFPINSTPEWEMMAWDASISGGEGMIARHPGAAYKAGRDSNILRLVPQDPNMNRKTA